MGRRCGRPESAHGRSEWCAVFQRTAGRLPVHCLAWSVAPRRWQELGVACVSKQFVWQPMPENSITPRPRIFRGFQSCRRSCCPCFRTVFVSRSVRPQLNGGVKLRASCSRASTFALDYGFPTTPLRLNIPGNAARLPGASCERRSVGGSREQDLTAQVDFAAVEAIETRPDSGRWCGNRSGAGSRACSSDAGLEADSKMGHVGSASSRR